ncbi:replication initiator protein A (plasmid) [Peteryoungia desertarenae]|uniref:Replication initiator protein A n=1 Tax=Peteryoungia desertarenae TaxID=1813451 RepID=A0ABX6QUV0_9HYPH|nr:replication initiator protein A [Peteryoungia desertarenae]QLF72055.1 replication initiator protein A [Peteryoungia desertarenae]
MTKSKLNLMSREQFGTLTLHEKNAYLQKMADDFADANQRERIELDKDGLSRLRRYYSRRVWADLKLDEAGGGPLNRALRSLGEGIRNASIEADVTGALMSETKPKRVLRSPPQDDAQLMFFVPTVYDAPLKDDVNLMDVAPFSLSKRATKGIIKYELKDCLITIEGGAESGLATVFDYDIFLNMVSYLAEEVQQYRREEAKGLRPNIPPKTYRPSASHILKFCRRSDGGKSYEDLEAALDRLANTTIKVVNLSGGNRRQVDSRPLIGGYSVVSRTGANKIDTVEITIPDWVYTSVVRSDKKLPLLTLHQDYFLISSGIGRYIYRLARKAAGKTEARYSISELHRRSGSSQELRKFAYDLREFVTRTQAFPMPEYDLAMEQGREEQMLYMRRRNDDELKAPVDLLSDA